MTTQTPRPTDHAATLLQEVASEYRMLAEDATSANGREYAKRMAIKCDAAADALAASPVGPTPEPTNAQARAGADAILNNRVLYGMDDITPGDALSLSYRVLRAATTTGEG